MDWGNFKRVSGKLSAWLPQKFAADLGFSAQHVMVGEAVFLTCMVGIVFTYSAYSRYYLQTYQQGVERSPHPGSDEDGHGDAVADEAD